MSENIIRSLAERSMIAQHNMLGFSSRRKRDILYEIANALEAHKDEILEVNAQDVQLAKEKGRSAGAIGRLEVTEHKLRKVINACCAIADMADPIGTNVSSWIRPNGLEIVRQRVPIGVVGLCVETRCLVSVIAAAQCLKVNNSLIVVGDGDSARSVSLLLDVVKKGAISAGMPEDAILYTVGDDYLRNSRELLTLTGLVDVGIIRGGHSFVEDMVEHAWIPVLKHEGGMSYIYVDKDCDIEMASRIILNSRLYDPFICTSADAVLLHKDVVDGFSQKFLDSIQNLDITLSVGENAKQFFPDARLAKAEDWIQETTEKRITIGVVDSIEDAINIINKKGSHLVDAIVTKNQDSERIFTRKVDSAVVCVNSSTTFTDGGEFGMGSDVGISTDKFNVRGPIGLEDLTSLKYLVKGSGQVRN